MPDKSYPEGVTSMDHIRHDMKMGRFPNQSSVETFLKERATLVAQEEVAHLPAPEGAAGPVAWAYEEHKTYAFDTWEHALSYDKPEAASYHRNIEPLFKHPPVAAEPVAWLNERIVTAERNRDGYEVGTASEAFFSGHIAAYMDALGILTRRAAAPTPPAGGGETDAADAVAASVAASARRASEGLGLLKAVASACAARKATLAPEPSPAFPAGASLHDEMVEALKTAQSALAMLTEPKTIKSTNVRDAWGIAVEAEMKCRSVLAKVTGSKLDPA